MHPWPDLPKHYPNITYVKQLHHVDAHPLQLTTHMLIGKRNAGKKQQ